MGKIVHFGVWIGIAFVVTCVRTMDTAVAESEITIISRAEWGARPPKSRVNMTSPVPYVIIHHSYEPDVCLNRSQCEKFVRGIQNFHMDTRGWDDIGYNFLVGGNGDVFEGRGWDVVGAQAGPDWNSRSIGICFIGNFTDKLPPKEAISAGKALILLGVEKKKVVTNYTLYGHRQVRPTECPGNEFFKLVTQWDHWKPRNYTAE
ncbi:peptidoglycan-recognition protein SC2-like isoform X2 [Branchiostoma lanceolatum]|uniref:peptidoglycan-recognition protein SC2-like isoform X2 n=1 Tax=Branchiostoma lanceolatum TaxID=7740 RepID=UPI0034532993